MPGRSLYRQAAAQQRQFSAHQPTAQAVTIPAPVGGWNQRDALDNMDPLDATIMDNWFPDIGKVAIRNGSAEHATGVGAGDVSTIAEFHDGTTNQLIVFGDGNAYNATAGGAATELTGAVGDFSEDRWQWVMFDGKLGFVNGTDAPQTWDGTTWATMTLTGTDLTAANVIGITSHQSRTYFFEDDSQDFYYSALDTLGGTVTKFPLSRVGTFGGKLVCMGSWNVEGGDDKFSGGGIATDLIVFVMSSGEAIVYQGTNPASDFVLVGVYRIGAPLDVRGIMRVGGDLIIMTAEGFISMSTVVSQKRLTRVGTISEKIREQVVTVAKSLASNEGWQAVYYPSGHYLLFNIPVSATEFHQYVMNTETLSWTRFKGMDGRAWGVFADELYFGDGAGRVLKADTTNADEGVAIMADAQTAFTALGNKGVPKRVTAVRNVLEGSGSISISAQPQFDFTSNALATGELSFTAEGNNWEATETIWEDNEENWDTGSELAIIDNWVVASGIGNSIGMRLRADATSALSWHSTTYRVQPTRGIV